MVVSGVCYVVYMFLPILIIFNYQLYGWNIPLLQIYGWAGKWFVIDFCLVIFEVSDIGDCERFSFKLG